MAQRMRAQRAAITLTEVLVVIGIVGVLVALSLPAIVRVREAANISRCRNNLRQIGIAVHNYGSTAQVMPPYATGLNGTPAVGWFYYLLPEVDQDNVLRDHGPPNAHFNMLTCPTDPTNGLQSYRGKTSYVANWYALGVGGTGFYVPAQPFDRLTDGLSNVVLIAEAYQVCRQMPRFALQSVSYHNFGITPDGKPSDDPSYRPNDYTMFQTQPTEESCDRWRSQTPHAAMHVCMADASVRAVATNVEPLIWKQALKPCDGAPRSVDW